MAKLGFVETDRVEPDDTHGNSVFYMKDLWLVLRSSTRLARESIAVIAHNRRPMNDQLGSDAKIRVAEHARQTLMAWRSGSNDPPEADHDREAWRQARWDELSEAIRVDPERRGGRSHARSSKESELEPSWG